MGCVLYEAITLKPPFRAEDMQGLYKKVIRGIYPKIPDIFSKELNVVIKALLQVSPQKRPDCQKILDMAIIKNKIKWLFPDENFDDVDNKNMNLLSTIRVPKNLLFLTDHLPAPTYDLDKSKSMKTKEENLRRRTYE